MSDSSNDELADFIEDDQQSPHSPADAPPPNDRLADLAGPPRAVDPANKILGAHIAVLVSALGGPDHASDTGLYKLGVDALACLRDLKRWIRAVDERSLSWEVSLACAECGLVQNDLTVILCQWDKPRSGVMRTRTTDKIMVACLELLVLLTWPTDVNSKTTADDYSARAKMRIAQLRYKHHILTYRGGRTLKAALRLGLPALRASHSERTPRDLSILRLLVYFIRNLLYIEPLAAFKGARAVSNALPYPASIPAEELSVAAVASVFGANNVFMFLTSIAHSILGSIRDERFGFLAMECLWLLTREVDVDALFVTEMRAGDTAAVADALRVVPPAGTAAGLDLSALLSEEERRKKRLHSAMATRHGRFGTLLSLQSADKSASLAVSGQRALASTYSTLQKLDQSKRWHKTATFRYNSNAYVRTPAGPLRGAALTAFLAFVDQLLASGSFDNLVTFFSGHLTNVANSTAGRACLLSATDAPDLAAYFLTVAWFFRFKRVHWSADQNAYSHQNASDVASQDAPDYGSVGAALSEVNFILLVAYVRSAYQSKDYSSLHVAMVCLCEMVLIANSLFSKKRTARELELASAADINKDRELAEGILRKLFVQKEFLDVCVNIPKTAHRHSPEYLGVAVSLVHLLLRAFEALSNEDVHLFLRTRRRMRKLGVRGGLNHEMDREHWHLIDRGSDDEDDAEQVRVITHERKLDFRAAEARFFHPHIVSTHVRYLIAHEDLSAAEIKMALSYFYRLFVLRRDHSALYRLDFVVLLSALQSSLARGTSIRRHVDEFLVYFMKRFLRALATFPTAIEVLFPRFERDEYCAFLSHGDVAVFAPTAPARINNYFDADSLQPRAAPVMQFVDPKMLLDAKVAALTYHLLKKKNTTRLLAVLADEFVRIATETLRSDRSASALRLGLAHRRLVVSNLLVRLLLSTAGFDLPFLQNDETEFRRDASPDALRAASDLVRRWTRQHQHGSGDIEPFLDQFQHLLFSEEQLAYGAAALQKRRSSEPLPPAPDVDPATVEILIGLARRRKHEAQTASRLYNDTDMSGGSGADVSAPTSRRRAEGGHVELSSSDDEIQAPRRKRVRGTRGSDSAHVQEPVARTPISAALVGESDDDSDTEATREFYEREARLRELIALRGGVASKDDLRVFQESWAGLALTGEVRSAVTRAAGLFSTYSDSDDAEVPGSEPVRKKRVL
ncbi:timeless-domain-containing protein [Metschnikowia bicuspidata]|uniref:Topoisomerase 1-associated factor 1 n=1 Tax=Metschnikowia bicuspidata TaxID=27322 RepID=A0A4P9ZGQ0_9ASCO|nr:timeless-domain-containing protein [Metschnikowia bicuspidata]